MKKPLFAYLLITLITVDTAQAEYYVDKARKKLKNYGLARCIHREFLEDSDAKKDIGVSIGAYGFLGRGMYFIEQNEETLKTLHDPYNATMHYYLYAYDRTHVTSMLSNKKIVVLTCLDIYNSKELDLFIITQDKYMDQERY